MKKQKKEIQIDSVEIIIYSGYVVISLLVSFLLLYIIQHFGDFIKRDVNMCFISPLDNDTCYFVNHYGELNYSMKATKFYIPNIFEEHLNIFIIVSIIVFLILCAKYYLSKKYSIKFK